MCLFSILDRETNILEVIALEDNEAVQRQLKFCKKKYLKTYLKKQKSS